MARGSPPPLFSRESATVASSSQRGPSPRHAVIPPGLPTFRLSGAIRTSPTVARCRLICHLAATIVAWGRLPSPEVSLRWLPVWLPESGGLEGMEATHL
jgi:hypothetical protein